MVCGRRALSCLRPLQLPHLSLVCRRFRKRDSLLLGQWDGCPSKEEECPL